MAIAISSPLAVRYTDLFDSETKLLGLEYGYAQILGGPPGGLTAGNPGFQLLHPQPGLVSLRRGPAGARTGRPPQWTDEGPDVLAGGTQGPRDLLQGYVGVIEQMPAQAQTELLGRKIGARLRQRDRDRTGMMGND
jgi:hypothetical protein